MSPISGAPESSSCRALGLALALRRAGAILITGLALAPAGAAADPLPPQIHTVAGGGSCSGAVTSGGACDNVAATSVPILGARSVAALPAGGYLYIDHANDLVREVSLSGKVTTVAGTTVTNQYDNVEPDETDVDNVPATQSGLDDPVAVAVLPDGSFLITEYGGDRVRLVSAGAPGTATITTVAGIPPADCPVPVTIGGANPGSIVTNTCSGYGGAAVLSHPSDAVPTADGGVLVADTYNDRILLLSSASPGAQYSTIAGGGASCNDATSGCQSLQAGQVELDLPTSVSEVPSGSGAYLISEEGADAIREVSQESASGTFNTVAGEPGSPGYSGDGGPAVSAQLDQPDQVTAVAGGGFLIADTGNNVVREVSSSGVISTIAGNGTLGYTGDAGDATAAELSGPTAVAPTINGGILIADDNNGTIREITPPPVSTVYFTPASPNGKNDWYTVDPVVSIAATENAVINCVLDPSQAPPVYAAIAPGCAYANNSVPFLANGTHTIYAASQNSFGDEENPIDVTFSVDTTPPNVICAKEPVFKYRQMHAKVSATLSDNISGPAKETLEADANTRTAGTRVVKLRGANNAGEVTTVKCSYRVRARAKPARSKSKRELKRQKR